jgi:Flp pilus assembly pilin Flp
MGYELMGRLHASWMGLRDERGQGTVEYVGLILLLAVVLGGIVAAAHGFKDDGIAKSIMTKLKGAVDGINAGDGK